MFFYDIKIYFFNQEMKLLDSSSSGYQFNINNKQFKTSSNAVEIPIKTRLKCFIRFKTYLPMGIAISIRKNTDFVNQKLEEHNFNNIINGIFFLAIFILGYAKALGSFMSTPINIFDLAMHGWRVAFWDIVLSIQKQGFSVLVAVLSCKVAFSNLFPLGDSNGKQILKLLLNKYFDIKLEELKYCIPDRENEKQNKYKHC